MIQSKLRNIFKKIYIKHIEKKSILIKNLYEKKLIIQKIYLLILYLLIKNGKNQYLHFNPFLS